MTTTKSARDVFYFVDDIMTLTGLSKSKSYKIIAELNGELELQGYRTISGRVSQTYFRKRYYGVTEPSKSARASA